MHSSPVLPSELNESVQLAIPSWVDRSAYPFHSRFLEVLPDVRMHYIDEGVGEVVLFVHGTPTWSFEWRDVIRHLAPTHRCIAIDHLGFGLSDRPRDFDYTPESHARVLRAFVDRLGLDGITLVVHDFGGPIGLPIALDTPVRVRRLVVLNSWMWSLDDDADMRRAGRLMGGRFGRFMYRHANVSLRMLTPSAYADRRKLTPAIHAQYLAPFPDAESRGRVLWPLAQAILGSSAYYDSLWHRRSVLAGVPALIVWGTKDRALKPRLLTRWRTVLPAAHVVELPVGHWPQEESPDEVARTLTDFLTG